ncbi:hypothetical protein P6C48_001524 [Escherichia coli]|nr:hypothetical protein [Escherichia coli]EIO7127406.1 hypothetical protein [Escherichia coli]EIO7207640.1 hypothetical protein [Escherichia coli]EIQ0380198.1 hypothetical protein [Escherichia coli]EJN3554558.1 hypothetical protein [Escherichia coli]
MTTFTNSKLTDEYVSNATLIRLILWADQHNSHYVVAALRELQERRKADSVPVEINDDMAYAFHHALSDSSLGSDEIEEIKTGLRAAFANVTVQPVLIVPDEIEPDDSNTFDYVDGWNACREAMFQSGNLRENTNSSTNNFREIPETSTNSPVTSVLLPGGFTIEDAKELHEDLVRSHISQALSGEKMKKKDRDADLRWIHGVIVQAAWFVKASLEQNALSGNSPVIPGEVLSAIREVARIRADFDDFDGDRRGIGDCLDEAEQELIVTINKYASQLAVEPVVPDDVLEQTVASPAPGNQVSELTMWVKRLAHSLKYANSLSSLPDKAMEYLNQNGLISVEDVLR